VDLLEYSYMQFWIIAKR